MLEITDRAATALRSLAADQGAGSVIRICPSEAQTALDGNGPGFRLDLVSEPEPDDEPVAAPDGTQIWIAAPVAVLLEDKVLDSEADSRGWPTFVFRAA